MQRKEKIPPPKTAETGSVTGAEKPPPSAKNKGKSKRINRIPAYESLFYEEAGKKHGGGGFITKVFRRDRRSLIASQLLYIVKASPIWITPLLTSEVIDLVTYRPEGYITRIVVAAILFFVLVAQNVFTHTWQANITNKMIRRTTAGVRSSVVRKLQRLSITYHKEMESGKIQSKFLRDVEGADGYYRNVVNVLLPSIIGGVISVGISLYRNWIVTLFFVLIIPINVFVAMLFRKKMRETNKDFRVENERMSSRLTTMLQMLTLTKAHGLETVETVQVKKTIDSVTKAGLKLDHTFAWFGSLSWVVSQCLNGACLFFCVFLAIKGHVTPGEVVLFQSLFTAVNGSVVTLVNAYPALMSGRESVRSLSELMRADDIEHTGKVVLPSLQGKVDFKDVCYRYPDGDKDVVKDFNLNVEAGQCVAFVGASGSGKSTVINLIIGLLEPTSGDVLVDGVPLRETSKRVYRHNISVVPQNSILFSGTIRENITYGLERYTEEQLQKAVEDASVAEFLPSLPDGLETQVGEHGDKLSGGQKQRVCIARALIRNPKILIMDEATSALDNVSEYHVQKAIERLVKTCTTFIVAHRLSTIRNADVIVVMEEGEAVEIGSYEELMAKGGKFCELEKLSRIRETETAEN